MLISRPTNLNKVEAFGGRAAPNASSFGSPHLATHPPSDPPLSGLNDDRGLFPAGAAGTGAGPARRLPRAGTDVGLPNAAATHQTRSCSGVDSPQIQQQQQLQRRPSLAHPLALRCQQQRQRSPPESTTEDFLLAKRLQVGQPRATLGCSPCFCTTPQPSCRHVGRQASTPLFAPSSAPSAGGGGSTGGSCRCSRGSHAAPLLRT